MKNKKVFILPSMICLLLILGLSTPSCRSNGQTAIVHKKIHIDTISVFSKKMNKAIPVSVILPDNYSTTGPTYPVVYFLHGAGGDHFQYLNRINHFKQYADSLNAILVCPDGGLTSWWLDSPIDSSYQYGSFIQNTLPLFLKEQYHTSTKPQKTAIIGLSMGGYGAFANGLSRPDQFGHIGSISGGVDLRPFKDNWDIKKRLGNIRSSPKVWEQSTIINKIADTQVYPSIFMDCGKGDFFHTVNQQLHEKLLEKGIAHQFKATEGVHDWAYFNKAFRQQYLACLQFFNKE